MSDFVRTESADQALAMCQDVLAARDDERIGQITGEPGTGKTALTKWLAQEMNGIRVECWSGISNKRLMIALGEAISSYDTPVDLSGTADTLFDRLRDLYAGKILFVDEANHLHWPRLERLRALSDLAGTFVILCGTDLLSSRLRDIRIDVYVKQLRSRIGAKRFVMQEIQTDEEFSAYILAPRFGRVSLRVTRRFRQICAGNWRTSLSLGDACERLMKNEGLEKITQEIVETAATWMAGHK